MSRTPMALLLAASLAPHPLAAQDTILQRARRRADSVLGEWRQASRIADLGDSLERERAAGRDTITVGALRIIANRSPLPLREAAARAWPTIDSLYGAAAAGLAQRPYLLRAVDPDPAVPRQVLHVGLEVRWDLDVAATTTMLLANVPVAALDPALAGWLEMPIRPSVRLPDQLRAVYVQLVTAPSGAARGCFLGSVAQCVDALGLGDPRRLLEAWYPSPTERHALVTQTFGEFFKRETNQATYRACVAGSDPACTELLHSLPPGGIPKPLGSVARGTLVHVALRLGGRPAYERLAADPSAPLLARLASAAGVDADSLVTRWRAEVIAARPPAVPLPPWAYGVAGAWVLLFAACGLGSSRWRV